MIYKLKPTRVYRAYSGGKNLDILENKEISQISRFPEDWLASVTVAYNPERCVEGEGLSQTIDGLYLKDIIEDNTKVMLGNDIEMSLLFKLLDSAERLVIQAHPTTEFAKKYFNSKYGKTECWYILNDGGYVYLGFKEGITKQHWINLFKTQDIDAMLECLHKFYVKKGDMIFVDGGVPHAIGGGCFLAELQEPTDLMVIPERITPAGVMLNEQKLHCGLGFEKMLDCFEYDGKSREETLEKYFLKPKKVDNSLSSLVDESITDKFKLLKLELLQEYVFEPNSYCIVLVTKGNITLNEILLRRGERVFVPFCEKRLNFKGEGEVLICKP